MKNSVKSKVLNEKGITLVSLIVTVTVMVIIIGLSVDIGLGSVYSTRLKGFYMHLETIQKRADDIATTNEGHYVNNGDGTRTYVDLKTEGGRDLTSSQVAFVQTILAEKGLGISPSEFRYFTSEDLDEQLEITHMDYNVFIHFDTRTVISEKGLTINGKTYYMLENNIYYVEQNTSKNQGTLSLTYSIAKYNLNNYKVTVTPNTVGDLTTNGTLRYKKTTTKYWEIASGLEIVISDLTKYNIEYVDSNKNMVLETITLALDKDGKPTVTVNE